jgi:hypothetical protein
MPCNVMTRRVSIRLPELSPDDDQRPVRAGKRLFDTSLTAPQSCDGERRLQRWEGTEGEEGHWLLRLSENAAVTRTRSLIPRCVLL